jgi:deoxyribonuclease V
VVVDVASRELHDSVLIRQPTRMPYIPGLLSFREVPAALAALEALTIQPELLMVDGHGIAHPRRLGVATHLGLISGYPTIGVAKKRLTGRHEEVGEAPESHTLLLDGDERIGTVLRSRGRVKPIFISPGHRVGHDTALAWVVRMLTGYKLPEPTRQADKLASNR